MQRYEQGDEPSFFLERTPSITGPPAPDTDRSDDDRISDAYALHKNLRRLPLVNETTLILSGPEAEKTMIGLATDRRRTHEASRGLRVSIGWSSLRGRINDPGEDVIAKRFPRVLRRLAEDLDADAQRLQMLTGEVRRVIDTAPPEQQD